MTGPFVTPTVIPGRWDTGAVLGWLAALPGVPDIPIMPGAVSFSIPDKPDRIGIITSTGGGSTGLDGLETSPRFQLRIRGDSADLLDAERLAEDFDRAIFSALLPATINGVRVLSVSWSGSGPTGQPSQSGRRPESACTYVFRIVRPI